MTPEALALGSLLPTGNTVDIITLPNAGDFEVSLVDASVPCAFIEAKALGVTGSESIEELESNNKPYETGGRDPSRGRSEDGPWRNN